MASASRLGSRRRLVCRVPAAGTVLVSLSLSLAAVICAVISRTICTRMGYGLANLSTQAATVDAAIAAGPTRTSLLLVLLLRLSPVRPPPSHGAGGSARGRAPHAPAWWGAHAPAAPALPEAPRPRRRRRSPPPACAQDEDPRCPGAL